MNILEFNQYINSGIHILDGATGSNLLKRGMPGGVCPELWITEHPDVLIGLQREYIEAGSDIVYAPTFSANRIKLKEFGLEERTRELNLKLVAISREAANGNALVAGDLTMTGRQLAPIGTLTLEELIDVYKEQLTYLCEAGVDLLVLETMMSLQESRACLIARKEVCPELPIMVTMTFEGDGRTLYGTDPATAAIVLESLGANAIGANCSTGPDKMADIIHRMCEVTRVPIIAKPNAGLPSLNESGETVYSLDAAAFGEQMELLYTAGAEILGGCCGTTPEHIRCLASRFKHKNKCTVSRRPDGRRYLASERKSVSFDLGERFFVVGERINPTGKKKLQAELREGSLDMVRRFAEEQELAGAQILDVNMGMSGIDEKEMMLNALEAISEVTQLPLSLDSSHVDVMEAALRNYPGRALINSISMEEEKLNRLLPLAAKYGAMFILLPLSDAGLPASLEEKIKIIETICDRAMALGLSKEDIIVDGLVTTVGANPKAAIETLQTINYCTDKGLATIVGLSNISFGLPERIRVNTAFLTMAIQAGLTMAIANPSQEMLMAAAFASDMLLNRENSSERFLNYVSTMTETVTKADPTTKSASPSEANTTTEVNPVKDVYTAVLKGNRSAIENLTKHALDSGTAAQTILDEALMPAINEVGRLFDTGKYFLPQLIAGAETMKMAIAILEPVLQSNGDNRRKLPTVVIATVKGDIHDIGKNLVVLMLKNYGFNVIDLGKDVPSEEIVNTAIAHNASLIGLSALMTTTMQEMRVVVEMVRQRCPEVKVIIGGAVITQEYADEIHADAYSKDAADTVRIAKQLLNIE